MSNPNLAASVAPFPIMAWFFAPTEPERLQRMRDCGMTIAGFVPPEHLDAVHEAGLRAIVRERPTPLYDWANLDADAFRHDLERIVAQTREHPAVIGYFLKDEPTAADFPGLARAAGMVRELAPGAWPYINLFPNTVSAKGLASASYRAHLEEFIDQCKPPILSYDHYALMETVDVRAGYYSNLEIAREFSLAHGIPFWNTILSATHFNYRVLSDADFRFQVYTSLTCGARGISWFLYQAVPTGNYRLAPVDQFGNETTAWYYMQNINLQMQMLGPTLMELTSTKVYHLGNVPEECGKTPRERMVRHIPKGDYLVGEFRHRSGAPYVMIVNKSFKASACCEPEWGEVGVEPVLVSAYTGEETEFRYPNRWLAPGQGMLLRMG